MEQVKTGKKLLLLNSDRIFFLTFPTSPAPHFKETDRQFSSFDMFISNNFINKLTQALTFYVRRFGLYWIKCSHNFVTFLRNAKLQ